MDLQRNYYEVLGLPHDVTTDEIKKKYRELARKFHPDLVEDKAMGQRIFSQINRAYRVLVDPEERSQYDQKLAAETKKANIASAVAGTSSYAAPAPSYGASQSASSPSGVSAHQQEVIRKRLQDADMAVMAGDIKQAKLLCENVLQMDNANIQAMSILGDVLAQMRKPEEAAKMYIQALRIAPSPLLQAKLDRLAAMPPPNAPQARPAPAAASGKSTPPKPAGGLLNRIFGKS